MAAVSAVKYYIVYSSQRGRILSY